MTASLSVPEIQGSTQEVARAKVKAAAEILGTACITEDTALCFKAMNGLPGPFIKYFLAELGHSGDDTRSRNAAIDCGMARKMIVAVSDCFSDCLVPHSFYALGINKMLQGFENKDATALCTFGYCSGPGAEPILFEGATEGRIVPARGDNQFGWVSSRVCELIHDCASCSRRD